MSVEDADITLDKSKLRSSSSHFYGQKLRSRVCLCCHQWFLHGFVLLSTAIFVYKYAVLANLSREGLAGNLTFLAFYSVLENTRLYQNSKGNKTKQRAPLVFAMVLAVPALVCNSYFLQLQTNVLEVDRLLNSTAITLLGMQAMLALLQLFSKSTA